MNIFDLSTMKLITSQFLILTFFFTVFIYILFKKKGVMSTAVAECRNQPSVMNAWPQHETMFGSMCGIQYLRSGS